jgi:hypothetical protein
MKRKETAPRGSVEECIVLEWSTNRDRLAKRRGAKIRVSSGDSNRISSGPRGIHDEFKTPLLLWNAATLEEYEA